MILMLFCQKVTIQKSLTKLVQCLALEKASAIMFGWFTDK